MDDPEIPSLPPQIAGSEGARAHEEAGYSVRAESPQPPDGGAAEDVGEAAVSETAKEVPVIADAAEVALSPEVAEEDPQVAEIAEKTSHITVALDALANMPDFEGKDAQIAGLEAQKQSLETEVRQNSPEKAMKEPLKGLEEVLPGVMRKTTEFIMNFGSLPEGSDAQVLHVSNPRGTELTADAEIDGTRTERVIGPGVLGELSGKLLAMTGGSELTKTWYQNDRELRATATGPNGITVEIVSTYGSPKNEGNGLPGYVNFYLKKAKIEAPAPQV